uniref:SF-assemblin n=1 Tax=Zooxanthella nutricula TaxID=1333877 RepID=A0A7S2JKT8_9DINO
MAQEQADGGPESLSRLASVTERFSGFERQMDMDMKARKEADELHANGLRDNIARLEKTLNAEIKRRVEANKALQGMFDAQMATVQDKLEAGLLDRLDSLHSAVASVNSRVDSVEKDFSQSREQYIRDIEDKSSMVAKDAANLQTAFQAERTERKERENLLIGKLKELDHRTAERLESERKTCDGKYQHIREEFDAVVRDEGDKRFQDYILEEMAALKNGLVLETQTREHADDDIVNALHHYTNSIQEALRIVNQATA